MNWNLRTRQFHRWLSITFTLTVIASFAVIGREPIALYVGLLTLVALALLPDDRPVSVCPALSCAPAQPVKIHGLVQEQLRDR